MEYKVSIIMPALNEEKNLVGAVENVVASFEKIKTSGEIIIVNDGSVDSTDSIISELSSKYPFIRSIKHSKPHGVGASFWEGVNAARGDIVTWMPGDGENDCFEILRYVHLMDHVDILVPFVYNREVRTWQRRLLSKAYKAIINLSFGLLLNYMNGNVVYRRAVLNSISLRTTGFFFQTEILVKLIKRGYLFAEIPCALMVRKHGKSRAVSFKSLINVIKGYLSTMWTIYVVDRPTRNIIKDSVSWMRERDYQLLVTSQQEGFEAQDVRSEEGVRV